LVGVLKLTDSLAELSDLLLVGLDLSAHEFDLLGEVDELFFEQLSFSLGVREFAFLLGSLDGLVVE
jgi:hypothetical protein